MVIINNNNVATLKKLRGACYYPRAILRHMHCWFVLFVMQGVSGAEGEREVRCSGKDYSKSISKLQCNQTNITHSSTDFNTILIKLNYS